MRPTDVTLGTFEKKIMEAAKLAEVHDLTASEAAQIKSRIQFVLFGSNPAELTIAQMKDWIGRTLPGIRRSNAVMSSHTRISDGVQCVADALPASLRGAPRCETVVADEEALAAGEVFCSLVEGRKVRFSSVNMVVTPLRVANNPEGSNARKA